MKNVLIIDDEKSFLLSLKDGLSKHKNTFQLFTAGNGCEAVDVLSSIAIDLLVTDLQMPEMNGFEVLAWVRRHQPQLPVIVMSAFGTSEIESRLAKTDTLQFLDKPLDLDMLEEAIFNGLNAEEKSFIHGITLATFLQLMKAERKTCTLKVTTSGRSAYLYFRRGELINAELDGLEGMPAALEVVAWDDAEIEMDAICPRQDDVINLPMEHVLMEAFRLKDEAVEMGKAGSSEVSATMVSDPLEKSTSKTSKQEMNVDDMPKKSSKKQSDSTSGRVAESPGTKKASNQKTNTMTKGVSIMQEVLEGLKKIKGFMAVGVFSSDGELMAELSMTNDMHLGEVGAMTNDILLKAQEETDIMGVGRGSMIHIAAPKAHLLMRCLNENTDFHSSEPGRAHVHLLLALEADGNIALGKMQMEKVIQQLASDLR